MKPTSSAEMSFWSYLGVLTILTVARQTAGVCLPLEDCTLECQYGFQYDDNDCNICACLEPCKDYDCGLYEVCEVRQVECIRAPCPPIAACVAKPASTGLPVPSASPTPGMDLCLQAPQRGLCSFTLNRWYFSVTSLSCEQFSYGGCGGNANNFATKEACLARCLPTSVECPVVSCAPPCQLQYDAKGCNTCVCPGASCRDMPCPEGEECQVLPGQCSTGSDVCHPRPTCVASSGTVKPATQPTCPYIDCELMQCEHGFKMDSRGCKMCMCYDPCETYECPANQKCVVGKNDCEDREECRDGPARYCVDITTQPAVIRERPSPEDLMNCCQTGGMSTTCQSLCMTNLTVSSENIVLTLQCAGEISAYLSCVGGGFNFSNCCRGKGVGKSCQDFCNAAGRVDMINVHSLTQCVYSNDVNSVLSCYQEGPYDSMSTMAKTSFATSTPLPDHSENICNLTSDSGPCEASMERWYYNSINKTCEKFQYGGCLGNANNFFTSDDCQAACQLPKPSCPEVMCDRSCELKVGSNGCNMCACSTTSTPVLRSESVTVSPIEDTLAGCCQNLQVPPPCMKFCSYNWTFTQSMLSDLLVCETLLPTGLTCAKKEHTYTECCRNAGVTGECLNACGRQSTINDFSCLIDQHGPMLKCFESGQPDAVCPLLRCSNICKFGIQKDEAGCPTCNCVDPCRDMVCPTGQMCTYRELTSCDGDVCHILYRGQCTVEKIQCPNNNCSLNCTYGFVKNSSGCPTCECLEPCKEVVCAAGSSCKVLTATLCKQNSCETRYNGICAVDCPRVQCNETCAYDWETASDANGCDMCFCINPCKNVSCPSNQQCVPKTMTLLGGEGGSIKKSYSGECKAVCTEIMCMKRCEYGLAKDAHGCDICECFEPCQNVTCQPGMSCSAEPAKITATHPYHYQGICKAKECSMIMCLMFCEHGFVKNELGCDTCQCYEPCKNVTCDETSTCLVTPINVTNLHQYQYKGECVRCTGMLCRMICEYGMIQLTKSCSICECFDPCKDVKCGSQFTCVVETDSSEDSIQSYKGVCKANCEGLAPMCSKFCPYGFAKDQHRCETCECYEPCKNVTCEAGMTCEAKASNVTTMHPYETIGHCVPTSICSPIMCNMYCKHGFLKDKFGCDTCSCFDPCKNFTCEPNSICQPVSANVTSTQLYRYQPECVRCTGIYCRIICEYGTVMLSNSCPLCECFDPCKGKNCSEGKICKPKQIAGAEVTLQLYEGECVDENACKDAICPMPCKYGDVKDSNGCNTCTCYEPCKDVTCPTNMNCEVSAAVATPTHPYNYKPICTVINRCPEVQCVFDYQCEFGLVTNSDGCSTCECFDPCKEVKCQAGFICTPKVDENCKTGNCPPFFGCVPPPRACSRQQENDVHDFASHPYDMPQVNCDNAGHYKPLQCSSANPANSDEKACWCSIPDGRTMQSYNTLISLSQAIDSCFPDDKIIGVLKINADFSIIKPGNGSYFKQDLSSQLAAMFGISDSNVTITRYYSGSIVAEFVATCSSSQLMDQAEEKIKMLETHVHYNGVQYRATMGEFTRIAPNREPTTTSKPGMSRTQFLLLVILIPILVPLLIVLIIVAIYYICKMYKGQIIMLPQNTRASVSFDSILEHGGNKPGYENPSYDTVKVVPPDNNFSAGTTAA